LQEAARKCADQIGRRDSRIDPQAAGTLTEKAAAEASLELALSAAHIFEQWVQLERRAPPSILPEVRVGCSMALAAARGALQNVETDLAVIHDLHGDFGYISRMKARVAAIEARLSIPVTPGG
jgi:hypothetical protein